METLYNGYTLQIPAGAFPFSTDSTLLADFVRLPKSAQVLDLGSGCGTIGTLLCAKDPNCQVTGIELDEKAHHAALENIAANSLQHRLQSICGDLAAVSQLVPSGSFGVCVSNPPYFTAGPLSQSTPIARHEQHCSLDDWMGAAAWALKYGGDFFLVHKPERLSEIFCSGAKHKLEPKRLCLVRHRQDGPIALVLVQCRKGAKPGLIWEERTLFTADGSPTVFYKQLYHLPE